MCSYKSRKLHSMLQCTVADPSCRRRLLADSSSAPLVGVALAQLRRASIPVRAHAPPTTDLRVHGLHQLLLELVVQQLQHIVALAAQGDMRQRHSPLWGGSAAVQMRAARVVKPSDQLCSLLAACAASVPNKPQGTQSTEQPSCADEQTRHGTPPARQLLGFLGGTGAGYT